MYIISASHTKTAVEILSMDYLTIGISMLALLISVWQWVRTLLKERFAIKIKCTGYQLITSEQIEKYRNYTFGFIVDNLSSVPVSISRISFLSDDNAWTSFRLTKRFMKEHFIPPGLDNPYRFFTSDFPVNIDSHSSVLIYAAFETTSAVEVSFDGDNARFMFETSRKSKSLSIKCIKMSVLEQ